MSPATSSHDLVRFIAARGAWSAAARSAAPRERRCCLPTTRFLRQRPSGGIGGNAGDIAIPAQAIVRPRRRIAAPITRETGKSLATVLRHIERDDWPSADEARDHALVGRIIRGRGDLA